MLGSGTWRSKVHPQIRENIYKTPCCGCWHPIAVVAGLRISIELIVIHWGVHVPSKDVCNLYQLRILPVDLRLYVASDSFGLSPSGQQLNDLISQR